MSANGAYNHRTVPNNRGIRFSEAVDVVKREFELLSNERDDLRAQTEEYESRMKLQLNDINAVRRSLTELENKQAALRSQYEGEIRRLRTELTTLTRPASHGPPGIPGFNPLTTPRLGPAPPPHQGVAEGYGQPAGARDPRGATATALIDRGKDSRDKPRGLTPPDSETEWERRQKVVRERANSFRDNDRLADTRDAKRLKSDGGTPYSGPATIPSRQQPGEASSSRGDYQVTLPPINTNLSGPATGSPHRPPQIHIPGSAPPPVEDLNLQSVGPEYRKEASDWFVVFNPRVKRSLDINLMHNLMHSSVVCCVQFSSDGKYLATGCNRTAQIFEVKTGNKITVLDDPTVGQGGDLYIRSVRFSPDGKLLATGAEDRVIRIWDIQKKRIITTFDGHQQEIYSLDFSSSGHILASGSGDRTARIWDIKDGSCKVLTITDSDEGLNPNNPSGAAGGADAGVTSVAISPDGRYVAAGSLDTIVRIWDVITGKLVERLVGHKDSVYSVGFTPDGRGLVSGSLDKTLKYWDVSGLVVDAGRGKRDSLDVGKKFGSGSSSPCVMDFAGHKDYVLSVAVSKDGHWVVSGSKDRCVQFWDSRNAALQFMLQGHKNSVISLDINSAGMQPGNGILATGSGDNLARIWQYNVI